MLPIKNRPILISDWAVLILRPSVFSWRAWRLGGSIAVIFCLATCDLKLRTLKIYHPVDYKQVDCDV
jgi:hypothetical protein